MSWLKNLKESVKRSNLELAAQGFEYIKCEICGGKGDDGNYYTDDYGSLICPEKCRYCLFGNVKVRIDSSRQKLAMLHLMREIKE